MNILKRATSSLIGYIAVWEVIFALPLFLVFLFQSYSDGTLTVEWTIYLALLWAALGAAGGTFFWYLVSLPLIRGRERGKPRNSKKD